MVEPRVPGMPAAMHARNPAALALLGATWDLGDACVQATERAALPCSNMTGAPLLLFARILRALGATIAVVEQGYAHEAGSMARVALECLFDLGYLLAEPAQREDRAARFLAYEIVAAVNKAELAEKLGLHIDPAKLAAARATRQEHWEREFGKIPDPQRGWSNLPAHERARIADMLDLYEQPYRLLCDVSHNNPETWRTLLAFEGEQVKFIAGPQDEIDDMALVTLSDVMVRVTRLLADLFDLDELRSAIERAEWVMSESIAALND
jgi:hypothetical protein